MRGKVSTSCMDIRAYTECSILAQLSHFLLEGDDPRGVHLSGSFFRMLRAIGSGWTEALHVDEELRD